MRLKTLLSTTQLVSSWTFDNGMKSSSHSFVSSLLSHCYFSLCPIFFLDDTLQIIIIWVYYFRCIILREFDACDVICTSSENPEKRAVCIGKFCNFHWVSFFSHCYNIYIEDPREIWGRTSTNRHVIDVSCPMGQTLSVLEMITCRDKLEVLHNNLWPRRYTSVDCQTSCETCTNFIGKLSPWWQSSRPLTKRFYAVLKFMFYLSWFIYDYTLILCKWINDFLMILYKWLS